MTSGLRYLLDNQKKHVALCMLRKLMMIHFFCDPNQGFEP